MSYRDNVAKNVEILVDELMTYTNIMGAEEEIAKGIFKSVSKQHRTIQQSFFRTFTIALKTYSEKTNHDQRNQASVDFAKRVVKLIDEENIYFPFI